MKLLRLCAAAVLVLLAAPIGGAETTDSANGLSATDRAEALRQWDKVYEIFSHPRCTNCHVPADNRPRWSGPSFGLAPGEWIFHGMNVNGGPKRDGRASIPCSACHAESNSELPHGPPGAPHWGLSPVKMSWLGATSAELCAQLKDPRRTGGRSLKGVAAHIRKDPLVLWAWDPGPGRQPAPYTPGEMAASFETWAELGAPCPDEG